MAAKMGNKNGMSFKLDEVGNSYAYTRKEWCGMFKLGCDSSGRLFLRSVVWTREQLSVRSGGASQQIEKDQRVGVTGERWNGVLVDEDWLDERDNKDIRWWWWWWWWWWMVMVHLEEV
jgi:hypothetical protein